MKYFCAVFIGFGIIQTIPVESGPLDGVNNGYGSASAAASTFWNGGQGSNRIMQNGPSSTSGNARKNGISIDVDISQKQQSGTKKNFNGFNMPQQYSSDKESGFSLEIGGANNLFKFVPNKGNMNEQEMHEHISQYLKNMNSGSNIASSSGHGHGHDGQWDHQSSNSKNDISIDLDISTNSNNQNTQGKNIDPNMLKYVQQQQQGQTYVGLAATNQADGFNPVGVNPVAPGIFGNALGSVSSAASSLKDKFWSSKENTPPDTPQNGSKDDKKVSLDIDLDTDGDGEADQKINVDIDTKSDEKDLGRERNHLQSDHDAHMDEQDKGLKMGKLSKKEKKQKIKKQKNKHVSNMSWSTTTNHYHSDPRAPQPSVVQIHLPPPPMAMHHYNVPPPMPPTTTYNSMHAAASSLQSTTVSNGGPYAHSHAAQMPGYGHSHGPSPPTGFYGQGNAASTMNAFPGGMYNHADAAVNMQSTVPYSGAPSTLFNHMNQVPNMQTGPYSNSPMHGTQSYYGQSPSAANQNQYSNIQPQQYTQSPYH